MLLQENFLQGQHHESTPESPQFYKEVFFNEEKIKENFKKHFKEFFFCISLLQNLRLNNTLFKKY